MSLQSNFDIVTLNVLINAFHAVAEEMGINLLRSARSTIIREARDCSCALLDAQGRIVAEAEHIPVQMSSLSLPMFRNARTGLMRSPSLLPCCHLSRNKPSASRDTPTFPDSPPFT